MPNKQEIQREQAVTKSGLIPRQQVMDLIASREAPPPSPLPHAREVLDNHAITGSLPVVAEGEDLSAHRDDDQGSQG